MDKKQALLIIAIAVVFVFFVGYGIEVFNKDRPEYDDYCPSRLFDIQTKEECEQESGMWVDDRGIDTPKPVKGMCQPGRDCHLEFEKVQSRHDKVVFIAAVIIGLLAIIGGVILRKEVVSTGFVGGGILSILYGTIRYWQHAENMLKFLLLGIALFILLWIGYRKMK